MKKMNNSAINKVFMVMNIINLVTAILTAPLFVFALMCDTGNCPSYYALVAIFPIFSISITILSIVIAKKKKLFSKIITGMVTIIYIAIFIYVFAAIRNI